MICVRPLVVHHIIKSHALCNFGSGSAYVEINISTLIGVQKKIARVTIGANRELSHRILGRVMTNR